MKRIFTLRNLIIVGFIISLVSVTGCRRMLWSRAPGLGTKENFNSLMLGKPAGLYQPPENYPEDYKMGWYHGCESGFSAYGETIHKAVYGFNQDVEMMKNVMYSKAWMDSFNYCRAYLNRTLVDGMWWGEGFDNSDRPSPFNSASLRSSLVVQQDKSILFPMDGINLPGWGEHTWHNTSDGVDWLGRSDADSTDWLGRPAKYR